MLGKNAVGIGRALAGSPAKLQDLNRYLGTTAQRSLTMIITT